MNKLHASFLFLALLMLLSGCKKNQNPAPVSVHLTTQAVVQENDQIILEGQADISGDILISEFGFLLHPEQEPLWEDAGAFPANGDSESGVYTVSIPKIYKTGQVFYVSFYMKSGEELYYADPLQYTVTRNVQITDFTPRVVDEGDLVLIYGRDLGSDSDLVEVTAGHTTLNIRSRSEESIMAIIPPYESAGTYPLIVDLNGIKTQTTDSIEFSGPVINKVFPERILLDTLITFSGKGFSPEPWRNEIELINGYIHFDLDVISASETELIVAVDPLSIFPGTYDLTLRVEEKTARLESALSIETQWELLPDMPGSGIAYSTSFEIDDNIYVCTGCTNWTTTSYTSTVYRYNILSRRWTQLSDFPGESRKNASSFAIDGKGYLLTGGYPVLSDCWEYDPATDTWKQLDDYPGGSQAYIKSVTFNGKAYVGFGFRNKGFWEFDPADGSWNVLASPPAEYGLYDTHGHVFIFNEELYVIRNPGTNIEGDLWKYNFETGDWTKISRNTYWVESMHVSGDKVFMLESRYNHELGYEQLILHLFDPLQGNTYGSFRWFPGAIRTGTINMTVRGALYYGTGTYLGTAGECHSDFWKIGFDIFSGN
jgi:IPT/TIG domain/Kelch motif